MNTIHVDVVSAEESIFSGEARFVALPGEAGELGIYPRHTPLITRIKAGSVRIETASGTDEFVFVGKADLVLHPMVNFSRREPPRPADTPPGQLAPLGEFQDFGRHQMQVRSEAIDVKIFIGHRIVDSAVLLSLPARQAALFRQRNLP